MPITDPSTAYGVNFHQIKSHSSFLMNERLNVLFTELDYASKAMNESFHQVWLKKSKSVLYQIWKNIRVLVQMSPYCRQKLCLSTRLQGVYTVDVAIKRVEASMLWCDVYGGWTIKRNYLIAQELNKLEIVLRSVLQFFSYFFRPDYRQKPDVVEAAVEMKRTADSITMEQLRGVVGPNNAVDFTSLGLGGKEEEQNVRGVYDEDEFGDALVEEERVVEKDVAGGV
jgi:hypothetical protein